MSSLSFSIDPPFTNPKSWAPLLRALRKARPHPSSTLVLIQGGSKSSRQKIADQIAVTLRKPLIKAVPGKYIGETEKNLPLVVSRVARAGHLLFFDEADALFGKRTTVKDSHDRYANQETNYLLAGIRQYQGMIIALTQRTDSSKFRKLPFEVISICTRDN